MPSSAVQSISFLLLLLGLQLAASGLSSVATEINVFLEHAQASWLAWAVVTCVKHVPRIIVTAICQLPSVLFITFMVRLVWFVVVAHISRGDNAVKRWFWIAAILLLPALYSEFSVTDELELRPLEHVTEGPGVDTRQSERDESPSFLRMEVGALEAYKGRIRRDVEELLEEKRKLGAEFDQLNLTDAGDIYPLYSPIFWLQGKREDWTFRLLRERKNTECCICFENPIQAAFNPCGHYCVCNECANNFVRGQNCPVCRRNILNTLAIY